MELEELRLQTGYQSSLKHFRYEVKRVADENSIPGFLFDLVDRAETAGATRARKNAGATSVKITPKLLLQNA